MSQLTDDNNNDEEFAIHSISERLVEGNRLRQLTNKELVAECLSLDAADHPVIEEMMDRLCPGWEMSLTGEPVQPLKRRR